jgi:hypothetical protein
MQIASRRRAAIALILLLLIAASGCLSSQQMAAVRKFSGATAGVGDFAASELPKMRGAVIEMNVQRLALTGNDPELPGLNDLQGDFEPEAIELRVKAARTLKTYGALLLSLATDSETDAIKKASDAFLASVASLQPDDQKLRSAEREALGAVVATAGGLLAEWKKSRIIKKTVADAGPQVLALCDLLAADFDAEHHTDLAAGYLAATEDLVAASGDIFLGTRDPELRQMSLAAFQMAMANRDQRELVFERASGALAKLRKAQQQLEEAMKSRQPAVADIESFVAQAQALYSAVKVLEQSS